MYNEHFGFRESPFSAAPSSRFFYTNEQYQEALANLRYGIEWKKGLIVMTGEVGTGKTTLLGMTMRSLEATTHPVFVSYNHLTYAELLRLVSKQLGLAGDEPDYFATVERLREHLIAQHDKGHIVALLIDEAQGLSDEMFEDIRFLSNFESDAEKLIQIVLTGQPELERRLDELSLRHIKQRVVIHCRLAPLKQDEVGRYITVRLEQAGHDGKDLFAQDVIAQIALYSRGIPRVINIICDNALLLAYAQSKNKVTREMIQEVVCDLGLTNPSVEGGANSPTAAGSNERGNSNFRDVQESIALEAGPVARRNSGLSWMAGGVSLALVAMGGLGAAIYSWHSRGGPEPVVLSEHPLASQSLTKQINEPIPRAGNLAGLAQNANLGWEPVDMEATPAKADLPKRRTPAKQKESLLGNFRVTGAFSFVRSSPRSDANIIATLQPGTGVKVVSARGNYFRVQAAVDGRVIHGYVHREDAFFEPIKNKNDGQQKNALR